MATTDLPLSPGYAPANITDGGGAAAVTVDVINAMWNNAHSQSVAAIENANAAITYAEPAPQMLPVLLDKSYLPPAPPLFPSMDPNNGEAMYDAKVAELEAMIQDAFNYLVNTYFTHPEYYDHALAWCDRAIQAGGTGINPDVEVALWQRARAKILADSQRATEEVEALWAHRRWPMPPGALMGARQQIELDANRKLAEQGRDISIKSFDAELENVRLAVKLVIDQRKVALDAAGDYVKTLMLGPQTAMQLATGLSGLQNDYVRSLVGYYSAQVSAAEPAVRLAITDAQLAMEGQKANLQSLSASLDAKVRAALASVQLLGSQTSAALNSIGARASIAGNDSSQV